MAFSDLNPITVAVYYAAVVFISMISLHPGILLLSLLGARILYGIQNRRSKRHPELWFLLLFLVTAILNPLFSHNGVTVLAVVNDRPITLESFLYGVLAGLVLADVLYWSYSFSRIMTSDRLLYLFAHLSPQLALVVSMAIRFVGIFTKQFYRIRDTQKALGLFCEDSFWHSLRGYLRIFSILISWALENGIVTADSMSARGYGIARRTFYARIPFDRRDTAVLILTLLCAGITLYGIWCGVWSITVYPAIALASFDSLQIISCVSFGILVLIPGLMEAGRGLQWKYWLSRI